MQLEDRSNFGDIAALFGTNERIFRWIADNVLKAMKIYKIRIAGRPDLLLTAKTRAAALSLATTYIAGLRDTPVGLTHADAEDGSPDTSPETPGSKKN